MKATSAVAAAVVRCDGSCTTRLLTRRSVSWAPRNGRAAPALCTVSSVIMNGRRWLHTTTPSLKSSSSTDTYKKVNYTMDLAFEEPTFRYLCDGQDSEFRAEVRNALFHILPPRPANFTSIEEGQNGDGTFGNCRQTAQLFRALCGKGLISYAQIRSTPRLFASFYEVVASASPSLALVAAEHFTFAGMIATHAHKEVQDRVLGGVDSGKLIGCVAQRELIADEPPLNTEARFDVEEKCFILRGTGKFAVVGAEMADWALVSAILTLNKQDNHGTHIFAVQLRENGALLPGVSVRPIAGEDALLRNTGSAVIHFDNVRVPVMHLLLPFTVGSHGALEYVKGREGERSAVDTLRTRTRLATGALLSGTMKKLVTDVVHFTAQKDVVGPSHRRDYPYFGLQHIQTPLVGLVCKCYAYMLGWQRVLEKYSSASGQSSPTYEDDMRLAGVVYFLQEAVLGLHRFAEDTMGIHSALNSSGSVGAATVVQLRQEGADHSMLIREVAFKSITKNIGTSHWGWWLTNLFEYIPAFDRFVKNPFYSPRISELTRHQLFFGHKHHRVKTFLRTSREVERRKGGSEYQWYDWTMFRHRQAVHCGEAFMELFFMSTFVEEGQRCTDARGRKILRDIGWVFALTRQMDSLDYLLTSRQLSPGKAAILGGHLDNIITVLAPQCVNLVDAMQVPTQFRAPCGMNDVEPYWTIPGTNTHIQRGDKMTVRADGAEKGGNTKAEQEAIREEEAEFDLFHGLADEPSYAHRKE